MTFTKESDFEEALIKVLGNHGWDKKVLKYPTEKDLLDNWANILLRNNMDVDRLNGYPLTDSEMQQIIEQIKEYKTPLKLNGFINGKTIHIKRDNPDDKDHLGKEISLKIYDRKEIAGGYSTYQIAQQPVFPAKNKILNDRRGDLMLLINGMPLIHIELKKSGIPISQAQNQIAKYSKEGVFTGLFSLVQIFVAMTPEETTYYANPGIDGKFNKDFYFHWADFNNEPINDWVKIGSNLLSIPMAHQLIGFYTVADDGDGILKVMRSYQYYAASKISEKVAKTKWDEKNQYGGYICHTTGSGKTLTSFKAAQLIATSNDADKVVFLMDRIELGTQSLKEYRGFADSEDDVQDTEDKYVLLSKLRSDDNSDTLIVTSIQKMNLVANESKTLKQADLNKINSKRIVFIIDECHRSTFGDMLTSIKNAFPRAIFFGFTGTPIYNENQKKLSTTADIFGDELHRYSIADGIRDKNVLGFDPYRISIFKEKDLREKVALEKAKAKDIDEVYSDSKKQKVFDYYMDKSKVKMYGYIDELGNEVKGIEDYIPNSQYRTPEYRESVVKDILDNWKIYSKNGKFHAIFATSSIPEAIEYYRIFKDKAPDLKVTAMFDKNIDNEEGFEFKEEGLVEIIEDYNKWYGQEFTIPTFDKMKKDISARLSHKRPYKTIANDPSKQLDILIVVNQMLTGFDSKWVNTLYLDKVIEYENIIQAFSRTNRLFGPDKPHGIIRYYRRPYTMEQNIKAAIKLYSGEKAFDIFVDKLPHNLDVMNDFYKQIKYIFESDKIENFEKLPSLTEDRMKFVQLFNTFNEYLNAAKLQGFTWNILEYQFKDEEDLKTIKLDLDETIYLTLVQRYKEIMKPGSGGGTGPETPPYDIDPYITEVDTGLIDSDYMNSNFKKYIKVIEKTDSTQEDINAIKEELHKSFAILSSEEQKYANIILHDIESGDLKVAEDNKALRDYINSYMSDAHDDQIHQLATALGLDEEKLRDLMSCHVNEININEYGRFDKLIETVDKALARKYFENVEGVKLNPAKVSIKVTKLVKKFVLQGGFDIKKQS